MIEIDVALDIARPVPEVFAFLDAEENAPKWLGRCVSLTRISPGEKAVGSTLRYTYKEPGRQGEMQGEVTERAPPGKLAMKYVDKIMEVRIGFALSPSGAGTRLEHRVAITPRGFFMKLMTPMIRGATKKQVARDTAELKKLLEAGG